ncbi:pancreatic secretory granule membrane major glycoprotein GP2-like [Hypomesus transpacificus]|uniref:pancreatic secretory granule membrane major glycoprotein GP2-like n=1 Tax=Hypomesus transpacificus TaxID=137520 RepID=UPI001F07F2AA|nr:pancreatic secretory granule membrane major glycoprotein GP2-like [Hypomesus transpacificus]
MMRPVMMMSRGLLLFLCILSAFATTTAAAPMTTISAPMTTTQDLMTTSSSVQFWCGGTPCPAGQDCINVNGLLRCADPCEQYSVLDDAWRSTGYGRADNCDNRFSGQGWYRMFLDGNSTQMPETCVEVNRCGTQTPMWLNSSHPLLGDGVVEGDVCGHYRYYDYKINGQESTSHDDCCYYRHNIHVKSCPTNYYVYKFVRPNNCNSAYCAAVPTTTPAVPTTTPAVPMTPSSSVRFWCGATPCPAGQDCLSVNGALRCADPCEQYSVLDDAWRSTDLRNYGNLHCDQYINWQGWSRLFLGGNSTQMPETCVEENMCGTHAALWMTTPHPLLRDGVVERGTCGKWSWGAGNGNCCTFRSNPIHVKACPGNYYVYKFVKTSYCYLAYCAGM